jgi:hypothetical protein
MQSTTAKLGQSFNEDPSEVLSALNEWLKEIDIIEDHEEGTFEVLPRSTGNIAEGMLEFRIREIGEAIRLSASSNETVKLMNADELPKESDLESLWGWAWDLRETCRDVLAFKGVTETSGDPVTPNLGLRLDPDDRVVTRDGELYQHANADFGDVKNDCWKIVRALTKADGEPVLMKKLLPIQATSNLRNFIQNINHEIRSLDVEAVSVGTQTWCFEPVTRK